jgi:hypothetical protein
VSENHEESSFTIERVIGFLSFVQKLPRPRDSIILFPGQEGYGSHKATISIFQDVAGMLQLSIVHRWIKKRNEYKVFFEKYLVHHPLVRGKLITAEQLDDLDRVVDLALKELKDYQEK